MKGKLAGRTAVVTGAGSGIGRAMVRCFAAEGASVAVLDYEPDRVSATVAEILAAGGKAWGSVVDVTSEDQVRDALQSTADRDGRLDILCNNAGVMEGLLPVNEVSVDTWLRVLSVNLTGTFLGCHFAVPIMTAQGGGVILNTGSVSAINPRCGGAAYTAAKFGVHGLTKNVANSHGELGIRCNLICPGPVKTQLHGEGGSKLHLKDSQYQRRGPNDDPRRGGLSELGLRLREQNKWPPQIEADEIAQLALWLVSDDSKHVNGAALVINGGTVTY